MVELSACEVRVGQIGAPEHGLIQIGASEVCMAQVGLGQADRVESGEPESSSRQTGTLDTVATLRRGRGVTNRRAVEHDGLSLADVEVPTPSAPPLARTGIEDVVTEKGGTPESEFCLSPYARTVLVEGGEVEARRMCVGDEQKQDAQ